MPGPRPKPTESKRRAGNPGKQTLNNDPEPLPGAPDRPPGLIESACEIWGWLCGQLETMGLLKQSDAAIITLYCETWTDLREVRRQMQKVGRIDDSGRGRPMVSAIAQEEKRLKKELRDYAIELGLTPASRSRVHTTNHTEPTGKSARLKIAS